MTSLARRNHAPHERRIADALGVTDAQLDALLRVRAGYWPGVAADSLAQKRLAWRDRSTGAQGLTDAGSAMLARARAMGF